MLEPRRLTTSRLLCASVDDEKISPRPLATGLEGMQVAQNFSRDSLRQLSFDINVHRRVSQPRTRLHRGPHVLCPALMAIPV